MHTIHKFPVTSFTAQFLHEMPKLARILTVQMQDGQPYLWVMLDPDQPKVARTFRTVDTGKYFDPDRLVYLGTFQKFIENEVDGNVFSFNVFEVVPANE